jgi:uncharacterized protein YciI
MAINMDNRMLFTVVHAMDHPGDHAVKMRAELMQEHIEHVDTIIDQVVIAGPMFAEDNKTVVGSVLIYKTDDVKKARSNLEADPYFSAGVWDKISIHTFRGALGDVVGGKAF